MAAGWLVAVPVQSGAEERRGKAGEPRVQQYIAAVPTEPEAQKAVDDFLASRRPPAAGLSKGAFTSGPPTRVFASGPSTVVRSVSEAVIAFMALKAGEVVRWN